MQPVGAMALQIKKKMKYFIILITMAALLAPISSSAMLRFGGIEAQDAHIQTVKGFLYEALYSTAPGIQDFWKPSFVEAIVWLDVIHKDKLKFYEVNDFKKSSNEAIIRSAFENISKVAVRRDLAAELSLQRWQTLGKKVRAQAVKNDKGGISWKFAIDTKSK